MTPILAPALDAPPAEPLGAILSPIHDCWVERVARFLAPAMMTRASFWERWGAVRYLADEFEARFRAQCALVDSLEPLLDASALGRLAAARKALESTRAELIALGRRRGTAGPVAVLARRFLDQLECWCAGFELATSRFTLRDLSEESRQAVAHLEGMAALGQ
jgi:hypothetical protein